MMKKMIVAVVGMVIAFGSFAKITSIDLPDGYKVPKATVTNYGTELYHSDCITQV